MNRSEVLALHDATMRAAPPPRPGLEHAWCDGVLRTTGAYNFIGWWDFPPERAQEIVEREAQYFRGLAGPLEWKVYSHDAPSNLERRLADAGFQDPGKETFLVAEAARIAEGPELPRGIVIRRVDDDAGLLDFAAAQAAAFPEGDRDHLEDLRQRLRYSILILYVAYADGLPVASSRLELPPDRPFAGLWAGGVAPEMRGRGLYRAMVAVRAAEARRHGAAYLTVDALETSRLILQRLGFEPLATMTGWILRGQDAGTSPPRALAPERP